MNRTFMHNPSPSKMQLAIPDIQIDWEAPDIVGLPLAEPLKSNLNFRLFRLNEIGEGKPNSYRQAIANVFSSLNTSLCSFVYLLCGHPEGIELYLGVSSADSAADVSEAAKILKFGFEGNFLGAHLIELKNEDFPRLSSFLSGSRHFGLMTGVPSLNDDQQHAEEESFQGVERLVNSLLGEGKTWQLIIVAEPGSDQEIRQTLDDIYQAASDLSEHIKHSVQRSENTGYQSSTTTGVSETKTDGTSRAYTKGTNIGTSESRGKSGQTKNSSHSTSSGKNESVTLGDSSSLATGTSTSRTEGQNHGSSVALTSERTNKRAEGLLKHLSETLADRFLRGRSKGMYRTALYLGAEDNSIFHRLARGIVSTFQGGKSSFTPLRVHKLPEARYRLEDLLQLRVLKKGDTQEALAVAHSLPVGENTLSASTWLNTDELALIAGMPARELPGLKIRKSVDFALNTSVGRGSVVNALTLGQIVQHGRTLTNNVVRLSVEDLCKHVFVTGVTGAGKTTTCLKLLLESKLPFLVIEPAKTEYRALHGHDANVEYYCLGREDLTPFRLNPFQLLSPKQSLSSHIDTLKATLAAVFPMEAAMPQIVEEAIIRAYTQKGWMIHEGVNLLTDNPWAEDSDVWPTFSDLIGELDRVIESKKMGQEFTEKYRGSLVAKLSNLTLGTKGRMLNTRRSMNFDQLLDKRVVIELEELKDEQDKALFMGLIITRLAECMKQRYLQRPGFQHLTLIEEAHRLLTKPEPGDPGARKMGVEMFANLLAEVRKYGEGLIIADQIPNKLVADVIKNTNTKIVHRLFAADDRNAIGDAMGLSDDQKDFLPMLQPGETVIYSGGWHAPVRLKVTESIKTSGNPLDEEEIKRSGRKQLWAQRRFLLPHLAGHPLMQNDEILSGFLRDATLMLSRWLRLNSSRVNAGSESTATLQMRDKLRENILLSHDKWLGVPEMNEQHLADALACVFRDCVIEVNFTSENDWVMLAKAIEQSVLALRESVTAFDESARSRPINHIFESIKNLNSI